MSEIVVVGSINMDLVVRAAHLPAAGQTLAGHDFQLIAGGKGANQAVAASRMAGPNDESLVSMVGCTGDDVFGDQLRDALLREGIDTERVRIDAASGTGAAVIIVDDTGENRIIVIAGANGGINRADVQNAAPLIAAAKIVVMQFEVPLDTVSYAIEVARQSDTTILLNPAPAYKVPRNFLKGVDILVMNESESVHITDIAVHDLRTANEAAMVLHEIGVGIVVFTLGAKGAIFSSGSDIVHLPGFMVQAVDTTAAGDAFVGALAFGLARNMLLPDAVRLANAAGALAVTRLGAQPSLPRGQEVREFLKKMKPVQ